jgi:hypothetical protein
VFQFAVFVVYLTILSVAQTGWRRMSVRQRIVNRKDVEENSH